MPDDLSVTRQIDLPAVTRSAHAQTVDAEKRTVDLIFSTGASVRRTRWDGWDTRVPYDETIVVSESAINMERLSVGAPVLDSHSSSSTRTQVAVVDKAWIDGTNAMARVRFPSAGLDEAADRMFGLVSEGIVRNVSVGYSQDEVRIVEPEKKGEVEQRIVERWTPFEISFVTIPADHKAQVRSEETRPDGTRTFPAVIISTRKEILMPEAILDEKAAPAVKDETRAALDARAQAAEAERSAEIFQLAARHNMDASVTTKALKEGVSLDAFRGLVLDELAKRDPAQSFSGGGDRIQVTNPGESPDQRNAAMIDGIVMRAFGHAPDGTLGRPKVENAERAREFANYSLLELGAEMYGIRNAHRIHRVQLYDMVQQRSMMGSSDFPLLLSNALNKFLLPQYQYQQPTYRLFSAQKTFNDFKAHSFLRVGDFPVLEQLTEAGEFRNGSISENREQVVALTYGKIVSLSRQAMINDDLSALSDTAAMAGRRVADFENSVAWGIKLANSKAGPTMSDTGGLFNATAVTTAGGHANQAGTAAAVNLTSLAAARLAMRQQKSLDGLPLNINPSMIVAGPAKQTEIEQLLSVNLLATQISNVNPFNGGGLTRLAPVIDAYITDNAWYLYSDPVAAPTFVYGYVGGYAGPRFALDQPFRVDGLQLKVSEDFGFGAVDWRGAYRNAGA